MPTSDFVDHYEVLQCSPNATFKTLEYLFVHLAKLHDPEVHGLGNKEKFHQIAKAYQTLHDPESRRKYDDEYTASTKPVSKSNLNPVDQSLSIASDSRERMDLLKLFYARRRENMKNPGLAVGGMSVDMTPEMLDFHLWYIVERGWIEREEGGTMAITADGIDKLELASQE